MRKICAFMQTYSDNRDILFQFHDADEGVIEFLNSFDKTYFAFHNCSPAYREKALQGKFLKSIRNLEVLVYNSITYPQSFRATLERAQTMGFDYFVFLQDDVFTYEPGNLAELSLMIKTAQYNMLSLEVNHEDLHVGPERLLLQYGSTNLYQTTSRDFKAVGAYACDDGAYAARLQYLLQKVYNDRFFECGSVWDAENAMNDHVSQNPIERYCTNFKTFKRYNIVGGNTWNKATDLRLLNERFGLSLTL